MDNDVFVYARDVNFCCGMTRALQQVTGLIINPVVNEFVGAKGPFLILPQTIGLLVGAVFWGVGCDLWGRKYVPWFLTLVTLCPTGSS